MKTLAMIALLAVTFLAGTATRSYFSPDKGAPAATSIPMQLSHDVASSTGCPYLDGSVRCPYLEGGVLRGRGTASCPYFNNGELSGHSPTACPYQQKKGTHMSRELSAAPKTV